MHAWLFLSAIALIARTAICLASISTISIVTVAVTTFRPAAASFLFACALLFIAAVISAVFIAYITV